MSDKDDDHRALSCHLWEILDRIGLSPDMRESVVNGAITWEILWTLCFKLLRLKLPVYIFGSSCEATTTVGLHSDEDIMYCRDEFLVVINLNDVHDHGICYLLVSDNHTPPGYCKLQLVNDGIPQMAAMRDIPDLEQYNIDMNGRVVLSSMYGLANPTHGKHGPAYRDEENLQDYVYALRCMPWPEGAEEWLTRSRPHNWPPADQIQKIRKLGCFLVHVGHPNSPDESMEWRISFSLQERELMLTLNEVQRRCYILMKVTIKDMITSQLGDSISSYHCKTVLFYAKENTPAEFWVQENLINCILYCLNEMYTCVVCGTCPNYFIRQANLFDQRIHGDMQARVAQLLGELVKRNATYLFDVKCDEIGLQLAAAADPLAYLAINAHMSTKYANTPISDKIKIYYNSVAMGRLRSVNRLLYGTVSNTTTPSISTLEDHLARLSSITRLTEHTVDQTREAVQLMLPLLHTSLASHLAARLLQLSPGDTEAQNIRRQLDTHLQVVNASAIISCRLKLATIHYVLAEYNICEQILSVIKGQMVLRPFVYNTCACLVHKGDPVKHFLNTLSSKTMSCSDSLDKYFGFCVSFMPSEMDVTTTGLQFEMYKSVTTPPAEDPFDTRHPHWYEWSNVDSIVLLHLMQYLLYDKMGDGRSKQLAVHNLADVIKCVTSDVTTDSILHHIETAYNLLGWIYKREGDINMAAHCFVKSITLEPIHNAAKWHIADLYLKVHQARSRR